MPNWCGNTVSVSHKDPEMMRKFADGVMNANLFEKLIPIEGEWDYLTALDTWGTKWDVVHGHFDLSKDGLSGDGFFDTAWGPPIKAYERLTKLGYDIDATYFEPGMCFAGAWTSSDGDECFEYDFEDENWRDGIDNEDVLSILEDEYESWIEWNKENEEDA